MKKPVVPELLKELLKARSPSGYEHEAHEVLEKHVKPFCDKFEKDTIGNRHAIINPKGAVTIMLAGHMDELGLIVSYIDDEGFIYFDMIGGHDLSIISGRRVRIITNKGTVQGVTGKRAVHLLNEEERKQVPKREQLWIDIGAKNKKEALKHVAIGDPIVYDHVYEHLLGSKIAARACDDKTGCYVVNEVLKRVSKTKKSLKAKLVSVSTAQEEIGIRGATTAAYYVNPDVAIAVDVCHGTDHPECDHKKFGEFHLGKGPVICRGPNISPIVFDRLTSLAKKNKIPFQVEADPRPTGTDARMIQMSRGGVATAVVSIPLRYMHTPSEVVDLKDIENAVKLLTFFVKSIKKTDNFKW